MGSDTSRMPDEARPRVLALTMESLGGGERFDRWSANGRDAVASLPEAAMQRIGATVQKWKSVKVLGSTDGVRHV